MNNKKIGSSFEREMCEKLARAGYWVHFMSPDARGAQPFDVIAVRGNVPIAIDCKTCDDYIFRYSRLEDNQIMAFNKWMSCGNPFCFLFVLHKEKIYVVSYKKIKEYGRVYLDSKLGWESQLEKEMDGLINDWCCI